MGSTTPQGLGTLACFRAPRLVLPASRTPSAPCIGDFGAQYPAYIYPCPTLQVRPLDRPRMARGQSGLLAFLCMTLSFTTPRRFIPTLSRLEARSTRREERSAV